MARYVSIFTFVVLFSVIACSSRTESQVQKLYLSNNWFIQSSAKLQQTGEIISTSEFIPKEWQPCKVPGTVLAALVENGVYADPYYGINLKSIPGYREGRWLAMLPESPFYPSWWYRTEFELPEKFSAKNITLHLDGINYKANIWLNGRLIADSSQVIGMFRRFTFEISEKVLDGKKNILAIEVIAPGKLPDIRYKTKQLEATTGWDDHNPQPPDLNMGLWRDVYISGSGAIVIKHPYVVTDLDLPSLDEAHLKISAQLMNMTEENVSGILQGTIENIKFSKQVKLNPREIKEITFSAQEFEELHITEPRLWWPHPVGPQNLYQLQLTFISEGKISDRSDVTFGIREVSTYINEEGWRGYKINGKKILIRGGAWMTCDMLLRLTHKRYKALVRYAREANLNMLRSEGFSIRETDEFYDMCDKYGIMVTQQIFGRSIPDEELAVANVKDMILRIRNHPSLVHFLGHDETFPTPTLDAAYREMINKYTPERSYQPHSGAFYIEDRFKTGGTRTGTLELWSYANPSHYYTHKEDGAWGFAQSGGIGGIVAPYESMQKMMPLKDLWPPFNETFSFHTVLQGVEYFNILIHNIETRYGKIKGIEDFCFKGQVTNYASARGMFEAYARNKYDALGITTWKYDAAWPAAITWQYVDWYLNVGGAYYGAKKACEPLHVQYSYDDKTVYVINNYYQRFAGLNVQAKIFNFDLKEVYAREARIDVNENDKVQVFQIEFPAGLTKSYFLSLKLNDSDGAEISDNFYWFSTVPDIEGEKGEKATGKQNWHILTSSPKSIADHTDLERLPQVKLETSYEILAGASENIARVTVGNPTSDLAFMIHLTVIGNDTGTEVLPAYWDDNYFSLLPGESKQVSARFSASDLEGAEAVVRIDGWNIEQ